MLDRYLAQVRLRLTVLPEVGRGTAFALKGGTAINLFYRDLPRPSVDLDLYGGELHAALDCRDPRDLFDVKLLYENEG